MQVNRKILATPTVQYTLYSIHCTVYTVQYTLSSIHYTVYIVQYTLYSIHCTVYTVQYTLYSIHCTVYTMLLSHRCNNLRGCNMASFLAAASILAAAFNSSFSAITLGSLGFT